MPQSSHTFLSDHLFAVFLTIMLHSGPLPQMCFMQIVTCTNQIQNTSNALCNFLIYYINSQAD